MVGGWKWRIHFHSRMKIWCIHSQKEMISHLHHCIFFLGTLCHFSSHTYESRVWIGMFVWELSLCGNTVHFLPSVHTFLAWEMLHFVRIKHSKAPFCCCLPIGKTKNLLTETPHWKIKPVSTGLTKLFFPFFLWSWIYNTIKLIQLY